MKTYLNEKNKVMHTRLLDAMREKDVFVDTIKLGQASSAETNEIFSSFISTYHSINKTVKE